MMQMLSQLDVTTVSGGAVSMVETYTITDNDHVFIDTFGSAIGLFMNSCRVDYADASSAFSASGFAINSVQTIYGVKNTDSTAYTIYTKF